MADIIEEKDTDLDDQNPNKAEEYFETKSVLKTLRGDLKDLKESHPDYDELQKASKKVKELRDKVNNDEDIHTISEKISTLKERMELIKEIIKMELLQAEQQEVKHEGRILKLVQVLKEMKEED